MKHAEGRCLRILIFYDNRHVFLGQWRSICFGWLGLFDDLMLEVSDVRVAVARVFSGCSFAAILCLKCKVSAIMAVEFLA